MLKIAINPLLQPWVKNVYSLWVKGGALCGYLYTTISPQYTRKAVMGVKPQSYTHLTTSFTPSFFTVFFTNFNLLISYLYTLSTAPIIKTKELN